MSPSEFLTIMERIKKGIESAKLACDNAVEMIERTKGDIDYEVRKFNSEMDKMMDDLQKEAKHGI